MDDWPIIGVVHLAWYEMVVAAAVGVMRRITGMFEGYDANISAKTSNWATDIDGAGAEMAASKYLGVYWGCHVRHEGADVLGGRHVRSTTRRDGRLIMRKRDKKHGAGAVAIFVITEAPKFYIVGWVRFHEAMLPAYKERSKNGEPREDGQEKVWWFPQEHLHRTPIPEKNGDPWPQVAYDDETG